MAKVTYKGSVKDSDLRYKQGWTILLGRNLSKPSKKELVERIKGK